MRAFRGRLAGVICLTISASLAHTASAAEATLCKTNGVKELFVNQVVGFEPHDYCLTADDKLPLAVAATLRQVGQLHRQVAELLGVTVQELTMTGVPLHISGDDSGPLGSAANQTIYMGVFKDWAAKNPNEGVNGGVYVHEFGHWLNFMNHPKLTWAFHDQLNSSLASEFLGDLLALEVRGILFETTEGLPQCMAELRWITDEQTYLVPASQFHALAGIQGAVNCCKKEAGNRSTMSRFDTVCTWLEKASSFMSELKAPSEEVFSAEEFAKNFSQYDSHILGVPVNSFLIDLSNVTGLKARRLFLDALKAVSDNTVRPTFTCDVPALVPQIGSATEQAFSMNITLLKVREMVSEMKDDSKLIQFDTLWAKHGLALISDLSLIDSYYNAFGKGMATLQTRMRTLLNEMRKKGQDTTKLPCMSSTGPTGTECEPSCRVK